MPTMPDNIPLGPFSDELVLIVLAGYTLGAVHTASGLDLTTFVSRLREWGYRSPCGWRKLPGALRRVKAYDTWPYSYSSLTQLFMIALRQCDMGHLGNFPELRHLLLRRVIAEEYPSCRGLALAVFPPEV